MPIPRVQAVVPFVRLESLREMVLSRVLLACIAFPENIALLPAQVVAQIARLENSRLTEEIQPVCVKIALNIRIR